METIIISAVHINGCGIGGPSYTPWKDPSYMKWFAKIVGNGNNAVIMGRKTYESVEMELFPGSKSIIVSRSGNYNAMSLREALKIAELNHCEKAFIIGGAQIYEEALDKKLADTVLINWISNDCRDFDAYFPIAKLKDGYVSSDITLPYESEGLRISVYHGCSEVWQEETLDAMYLKLLQKVLRFGTRKHTRSGDTRSLFGESFEVDLKDGLPVLTTKKVYTKGCIHELLWFLKGDVNIKYLIDNDVHIWDDDAYRYFRNRCASDISKEDFLKRVSAQESAGEYAYGDLGPVYGKQWRDWNGIDQIKNLVTALKNNPSDRRMIVSAFNVGDIDDMALPPCHCFAQWYAEEREGEKPLLHCQWYQRSVDLCLGFPFNILSYAVLSSMIAQVCGMEPGRLKCCMGDVHVYENQISGALEQLGRNPYRFWLPKLKLNPDITDITDFKYEDIAIEGYASYPAVKYPLSTGLS